MANATQAKIITPQEIDLIRRPLSRGFLDAAGLLKNKKINALKYQRMIRQEWERRLQGFIRK